MNVGFHKILPAHIDDYIENMRICAAKSNEEPGCIRYEVTQDVDDPTTFCLYQLFTDEAAFEAHQVTEHHKHWMELSGGWRDVSPRRRNVMRFITPEPA